MSRSHQQHSAGSKTTYSSASSASRDSTVSAQNLLVLTNKYNAEQSLLGSAGQPALSITSPGGDSVSQSNINQNNNQGNVRQGGDGLLTTLPSLLTTAQGLRTSTQAQSSSEPSTFPLNTLSSQFSFSSMDQLMLMAQQQQQLQRQLQGASAPAGFPSLPMLSVNTPSLADHVLLEMATRARADSFHSGIFLNSPATSKLSDVSQDCRVTTPVKDRDSASHSLLSLQQHHVGGEPLLQPHQIKLSPGVSQFTHMLDQEDREVSRITSGEQTTTHDQTVEDFLAERKRHASAPDKLPCSKPWQGQLTGKIHWMYLTPVILSSLTVFMLLVELWVGTRTLYMQ